MNDALAKRKEQIKAAKKNEQYSDDSGPGSNKNAMLDKKTTKIFEKKIEDFEQKFTEKELEMQDLKSEIDVMKITDK